MTGDLAAAVFDVDGVLTDTATLHLEAWTALFDGILVDGRPRFDGLRAVLDDRGRAGDDLDRLQARKQELFAALVERNGVSVYPDVGPYLD